MNILNSSRCGCARASGYRWRLATARLLEHIRLRGVAGSGGQGGVGAVIGVRGRGLEAAGGLMGEFVARTQPETG